MQDRRTHQADQLLERHLTWEACYNARDLGGLLTVDGGQTRWQAIIRCDHLGRLTPQGQHALLDYGVQRAIANARPGGVVIHCHSGTDRTGIVAALLLSLVGVPAETIAADYAESQIWLRPLYEKTMMGAGSEEQAGFWLKPTATPEMMHTMLAHIDTTYGGVHKYSEGAGLSPVEIERLKGRLRFA